MKLLCIIFIIQLLKTTCYEILPYTFNDTVIKYNFCYNIDKHLQNITIQVMSHYNNLNYNTLLITSDRTNDVIEICNKSMDKDRYGYATFKQNDVLERSIKISNSIMNYNNTLWNVMYHEILHTVGLDHTVISDNLMSYTVSLNYYYDVIPDIKRIYPGGDDLEALDYLYDGINESESINRNKIIKKLKKICAIL